MLRHSADVARILFLIARDILRTMTIWAELGERVTREYPQVSVQCIEYQGHEWLELSVTLCPASQVRMNALLVYNFQLVIGQLSVVAGRVVLRQTLPLDEVVAENLDEIAEFLTAEAPRALSEIKVADQTTLMGDYT